MISFVADHFWSILVLAYSVNLQKAVECSNFERLFLLKDRHVEAISQNQDVIISGSWKNAIFLLVYLILQKGALHYTLFSGSFLDAIGQERSSRGCKISVVSHDKNLVRAVLCYGLYLGICAIMNNGKSFSLKTVEDGLVLMNSNSVNARE
ncbi:hypothetical protein OIU84_021265 [Salix udensis]|uniref:Uncharacterized protein n=1 Tax=Salix udensis TaxID=889485 RepID=A0AAD6PHA5_9ROSI|nr:hypothetical protein OIU84_021265 [Salix udensis]